MNIYFNDRQYKSLYYNHIPLHPHPPTPHTPPMSLTLNSTPGHLYFLSEMDVLRNERTPYIKIGIVKNERTSKDRIFEHQTGNPRKIHLEKELETPFVSNIETIITNYSIMKWLAPKPIAQPSWLILTSLAFEFRRTVAALLAKPFKSSAFEPLMG